MNKSKIEWCDYTWNPVTGCLHGCEYCYARGIVKRFGISELEDMKLHTREELYDQTKYGYMAFHTLMPNHYPFGFSPTLHKTEKWGWRTEPSKIKKPSNIFVCSMADLFGEWVPDEWIQEVFRACEAAPQHRYLFLTKNPKRYCDLANADMLPKNKNFWYGTTVTKRNDVIFPGGVRYNTFLSIEPLHEPLNAGIGSFGGASWVIIGAETGKRKDRVIPEREWIKNIVNDGCVIAKVFMKNSLAGIWGGELIQEYPWKRPA